MRIDPQKYPTMYKAWQLEQEAAKVRSTFEYRKEAHKFFAPKYSAEEVAEAKAAIKKYQKEHLPCVCDGYCHSDPRDAYQILEAIRTHELQGEQFK